MPTDVADPRVEEAIELVRSGQRSSIDSAASLTGAPREQAREAWRAMRDRGVKGVVAEDPGIKPQSDGSIIVVSAPAEDITETPEALLERHGIDRSEWVQFRVKANSWNAMTSDKATGDNRIVVMRQLTVQAVRRDGMIHVPDPTNWTPPPAPNPRTPGQDEPRRGIVISDHHAPHHEPVFHALFLERLADTQPDFIEVNGDLLDFPGVSTHRTRDEYNNSVNECLKAGLGILRDYRHICPDAQITLKRGNHDERLDIKQIDRCPEVRKIAPGGGETLDGLTDERPWHDLRRLLYLDDLHIDYIDEPWDQAKTKLSGKLTARHGFSTSPNAGKVMLDKLSGSTIQGHDHRFAMTLRTEHTGDPDNPLHVRMAMSGGCACIIPGGLGYITGGEPDWQNAAAEFTIWPDGDFLGSPLIYVPGRLLAPDKRYTA